MLYKKKKFINWFLGKYTLKKQEASRILDFMSSQERLLVNTYFVESVRHLPNALVISSTDAATVSFLCRINNEYYEDIDEIISLLANEPPEELFVWLSFDRDYMCSVCNTDLELVPEIREKVFYHQVVRALENEISQKILGREKRKAELLAEIDLALEKRDRDLFYFLSKRLKRFLTAENDRVFA